MSLPKETRHILLYRRLFLITYDMIAVIISGMFALAIRYDLDWWNITPEFMDSVMKYIPFNIVTMLAVFYVLRLYHSLWEYASVTEMQNSVVGSFLVALFQFIGMHILGYRTPRSYPFLFAMFFIMMTVISRFSYRFLRTAKKKYQNRKFGQNVMIVGAGEAANMLIKEIVSSNYLHMTVKCLVDDSQDKRGRFIQGVRVMGNRDDIVRLAKEYDIDVIIISMPSASKLVIRDIVNICSETGCRLQTLPGMYQLVNEEVSLNNLRDVDVEDLLGRDPIRVDVDSILRYVKDRVILVTGGGGSIGSELCRQIAGHNPKKLAIVDIYENNA